jgi:hydroxyacylglutathione hydrolase
LYYELEDLFGDVVGKARRGQELSIKNVARELDIQIDRWMDLERYEWIPDKSIIARIGGFLGLDIGKLLVCAEGAFFPNKPSGESIAGAQIEMIPLRENPIDQPDSLTMNGYLIVCKHTQCAAFIDPGFECDRIIALVEKHNCSLEKILVTHGHYDHITALREVVGHTGAEVAVGSKDASMMNDQADLISKEVEGNDRLTVGDLELRVVETYGHTPGGVSYIGHGFAFVGDALFAGSLGGVRKKDSFNTQKLSVERNILSLVDSTILFPGHGPATTVVEERKYNPFFYYT